MLKENFCDNIRARRIELNLTATAVADEMGVALNTYLQYEKGLRTPGLDMVEKISKALKVNALSLLMKRETAAA